ncbi:MAG: MFS transporter, partial [Nesterenkonia sp.]|nr:MFS transporter [Nesterenkonia sp.]
TDKSVLGTVIVAMSLVAVFLFAFGLMAGALVPALIFMFLVAVTSSMLSPSMQTHLIDTAPNAPNAAASIHHSAFNGANALGAILGAQVIAWDWGLRAPSMVGGVGAVIGVLIALYALKLARESSMSQPYNA